MSDNRQERTLLDDVEFHTANGIIEMWVEDGFFTVNCASLLKGDDGYYRLFPCVNSRFSCRQLRKAMCKLSELNRMVQDDE